MDKTDHLMAENNDNNKNSQKGQVTPKNFKCINTGEPPYSLFWTTKFADKKTHFDWKFCLLTNISHVNIRKYKEQNEVGL